jgi:2-polyprenyl-3-methyl-5-hydroxy-6-metoxy-1,4-benzoquinol methylase
MFLDLLLQRLNRVAPGHVLDIGARDCAISRRLVPLGYTVDALDPAPPLDFAPIDGITYHETKLEQFVAPQSYDLVIASLVSHLVHYDARTFLDRLKSFTGKSGLIYVTLLGDQDAWAGNPRANALPLEAARKIIAEAGLQPVYQSVEWYESLLYSGEMKYWHLYRFLLAVG